VALAHAPQFASPPHLHCVLKPIGGHVKNSFRPEIANIEHRCSR
jgi:hypothetical protein